MYVADIAARRALYSPNSLAVVDGTQHYTYAELNDRANRLANWLRHEIGVQKGDRVAILAHNGVHFLDAFFACGKLGAVLTCLNWRLHWRETLALIEKTTPKVLLFSGEFSSAVESICAAQQALVPLHIERDLETLLDQAAAAPVIENVHEEDIACLIFTGGTTGLPKAAQVSHRMIAWNTLNTIIHDLQHGDVTVNVFPMFHTGGLLVYTLPLLILGGTVILTRKFDPAEVLHLLQAWRVTVFAGVPTMYQMLTTAPNWELADLDHLRFCTSGGAPLPIALIEKFRDEKGVQFKQGFGMSEFGPGVFALAAEDAIARAGSIGRPNFFVDARVVDEHNRPLPPGEIGELVLKGPSLCSGYFGEAETNVDDEGWFHTGDLARHDADWYFYIVDRKKDMFISGGENVYPSEIEQILYQHPAVHMCAVVGVPDPKWGEVGKAFVVLKPNSTVTADDLLTFVRDYLARYKVPAAITLVDSLPISGAGKILKRELREKAMNPTPTPPHP